MANFKDKISRKQVSTVLRILVSAGLMFFLTTRLDFDTLRTLKSDLIPSFLLATLIALAALYLMAYRWQYLLANLLNKCVAQNTLFRYYLIGAFYNLFLPGAIGGDIIRTRKLILNQAVPLKSAGVITLIERGAGIYGLLVLLTAAFLFFKLPAGLQMNLTYKAWWIYLVPVVVVSLLPIIKVTLRKWHPNVNYRFLFTTLFVILVAQCGDIIIAWLFSQYFGLSLELSVFIVVMPLVYFLTVLPISAGGLGVREAGLAGLLYLYGVPTEVAICIAFLMYLVKVTVGIFGIAVSGWFKD